MHVWKVLRNSIHCEDLFILIFFYDLKKFNEWNMKFIRRTPHSKIGWISLSDPVSPSTNCIIQQNLLNLSWPKSGFFMLYTINYISSIFHLTLVLMWFLKTPFKGIWILIQFCNHQPFFQFIVSSSCLMENVYLDSTAEKSLLIYQQSTL